MITDFSHDVVSSGVEETPQCPGDSGDSAPGRANVSRRDFIKGIIATGASISAMGYVFGGCAGDAGGGAASGDIDLGGVARPVHLSQPLQGGSAGGAAGGRLCRPADRRG